MPKLPSELGNFVGLNGYGDAVLTVSHDADFPAAIGVETEIELG